jgi:hypothetical protein
MIIKILIEQHCIDSKAADDLEALVQSTFPDAQIRGSRGEYFKLGAAAIAEENARRAVVRTAIETDVRAEVTDTIREEQTPIIQQATIEAIVAGDIRDPRITVNPVAEPIEAELG